MVLDRAEIPGSSFPNFGYLEVDLNSNMKPKFRASSLCWSDIPDRSPSHPPRTPPQVPLSRQPTRPPVSTSHHRSILPQRDDGIRAEQARLRVGTRVWPRRAPHQRRRPQSPAQLEPRVRSSRSTPTSAPPMDLLKVWLCAGSRFVRREEEDETRDIRSLVALAPSSFFIHGI